jgi:hypothetical protein
VWGALQKTGLSDRNKPGGRRTLDEERIGSLFLPYGCGRPVAWIDYGLFIKSENLTGNGLKKLFVGSTRQIESTYRTGKEGVADEHLPASEEADASRGVPRRMKYGESFFPKLDRVAFGEVAVRRGGLVNLQPKEAAVVHGPIEQKAVRLMNPNRNFRALRESFYASNVIRVTVGQQYLFDGQIFLLQQIED